MGVYIKGMEMPKDCRTCQLKMNCTDCEGWECCCLPLRKAIGDIGELLNDRRRDDCPLVPVPPHGRLIDADALDSSETDYLGNHLVYLVDIDDAPTILPAEEAAE